MSFAYISHLLSFYNTIQKFKVCKFLFHQGCIYLIKSTVQREYCKIILQIKITFLFECFLKYDLFLWW